MPCEDTMRESQRLALEQWKADQQARCRAAYAPLLPPDRALYDAVLSRIRRENAAKRIPDPICSTCSFPIGEDELDKLFPGAAASVLGTASTNFFDTSVIVWAARPPFVH